MTTASSPRRCASGLRFAALAFVAAVPAAALAQTAPAPAAAQATPAPSPLSQIPGVSVSYYDVAGTTIPELIASIEAQRPKDPTTGAAVPVAMKWSIGTSLKKETTGNACKIIGATAILKGEVVMPRLVNAETVSAPVVQHWQAYVTSLEQQAAARLRQPYQRLSEVEQAVLASSCEGAGAAASKVIDEITKAPTPPVPATPAPAQ